VLDHRNTAVCLPVLRQQRARSGGSACAATAGLSRPAVGFASARGGSPPGRLKSFIYHFAAGTLLTLI